MAWGYPSEGDKHGHYLQRHARRRTRRRLLAEELAQQPERGVRRAGRSADRGDRDAQLPFPGRPRLALHSGRDHRIPGRGQGWGVRPSNRRNEPPYSPVTAPPPAERRLKGNSLANWYLASCGNAEGLRHQLNCHTSLFRKREITWETGPHPATI